MHRNTDSRGATCSALAILLIGLTPFTTRAAGDADKERPTVAKCVTYNGAVLEQVGKDTWEAVKEEEKVRSGTLLVALPRAVFLSQDGSVEMRMLADIGQRGPFPVLETAVVFNRPKDEGTSLDVEFDRGIVVFVNKKEKGAAKVAIRFRDQDWTLTLREPGSKVGLELYSRHLPGLPKIVDGKIEAPTTYVVLLVLKGEAFLDSGEHGVALQAPPGRARVQWESDTGTVDIQKLEKLPASLIKAPTKEELKLFLQICACASKLRDDRKARPLLDLFLKSNEEVDRKVGVTAMGAIDDLPRLIGTLEDKKHADVRDHAILVLRHWMGRSKGQVGKLYEALKKKGYSDVTARTILQLLFGFGPQHRNDANTFALLMAYLRHSELPVRELAHWHLVRLAPSGKDIPYDAAAPAKERGEAVEQWQKLIGKLTSKPTRQKDGR